MHDVVLTLHWLAGAVALVVVPLALAVRKGGRWHRRWGWAFVGAMALVCLSAIVVSVPKRNFVMALVALFSGHLVLAGWRSLWLKDLHRGQRPTWVDWALHGSAAVFNAGLLLWGIMGRVLRHDHNPMYIVFAVFGAIGMLLVFRFAWQFWKRRHERHEWLFDHITGMLAGYIATVSAFSAVNLADHLPTLLTWLWPTLVGTPAIVFAVRYYRKRYGRNRTPHDDFKVKIR